MVKFNINLVICCELVNIYIHFFMICVRGQDPETCIGSWILKWSQDLETYVLTSQDPKYYQYYFQKR